LSSGCFEFGEISGIIGKECGIRCLEKRAPCILLDAFPVLLNHFFGGALFGNQVVGGVDKDKSLPFMESICGICNFHSPRNGDLDFRNME
jgi:hypothetical protein